MQRTTEDKVVLVISIVLVIITAVALNVRPSEAAFEIKFESGAHDTAYIRINPTLLWKRRAEYRMQAQCLSYQGAEHV